VSIQHMQMVLDAQGLSSPEKFVLLVYCNHAQPDGCAWPHPQRVADETGLPLEEVERTRSALAGKGLIDLNPDVGLPIPYAVQVNINALHALRRTPQEYESGEWVQTLDFPESGPPPKRTSVVYLIGTPGSSIAKIGVSKNLDNRLRGLQGSSAAPVEVLWHEPGDRLKEAWLHARFSHLNSHGEWFDFGDLDPVATVANMAKKYECGAK